MQSQTTNDVLALHSGGGCFNAMLDRKGRLQAFFSTHRFEDEYWIIIERAQVPAFQQRLETHLFLEEVSADEVGADTLQILVEGPRALIFLAGMLGGSAATLPDEPHAFTAIRLLGDEVLAFRHSESGEDGFLIVPAPGEAQALYEALLERGGEYSVPEIEEPALHALRFEAGVGQFGRDVDEGVIISETPMVRDAVSYDKGCYQGQEVVQRLRTYGAPKQALMGLVVEGEGAVLPAPGDALTVQGEKIGRMRSSQWSPTFAAWLAYAYLDRNHRTPDQVLEVEGPKGTVCARVAPLPFYTGRSRAENARIHYDEALRQFEADTHDEQDTAIELLKEAIILRPDFEDAYEALGVILHRHQRTDEAIQAMKQLERINPNSVMAHTNLSVFYVSKGLIQEAEAEKAKAEHLQLKQQLDARETQRMAAAQRATIRREAQERIQMFREVLEVDPEDPVALLGLGRAHVQLEEPEQALPYYEQACHLHPDYSAAFLDWGKCLEFLGRVEEAAKVYANGIAAAGRKGDLMPLREMERRRKALTRPPAQSSPAATE
ncbi:MAG: tetratricopeptide repeat protein [Candidatus Hydrogenedentes bacterium]|nr:tetratricopeptide repeat protein [Candidatus Hydrogenedentota bacterium]